MNEKIDIKPIYLPPFKRFCMTIGELPTSYVETMSYYEMLLWFTKYLGDTVIPAIDNNAEALKEVQNLFVDLQEYVNTYFDNLDLQTEIDNKLDEMVEDGTLAEIVSDYLGSNISKKINSKLFVNRIGRKIYKKGNAYWKDNDPTANYFARTNGFCMIDANTCAVSLANDGTNYQNNKSLIQIISLESGNVLREIEFDGGHTNSLTYIPSKNQLISCDCYYFEDGNVVTTNNFEVFNYSNLTEHFKYEPVDIPDIHASSVTYDKETNKLYLCGDDIYELNVDNFSTIRKIEMDYTHFITTLRQNVIINDNIIYCFNIQPNTLTLYDMDSNIINHYNFDDYINNCFTFGEIEGCDIYNGRWYGINYCEQDFMLHNICSFITFSIEENTPQTCHTGFTSAGYQTIYVDKESNVFNPDGSLEKPFKEVFEAMQFVTAPYYKNFCMNITLAENDNPNEYDFFGIPSGSNIVMQANSNKISFRSYGGKAIIENAEIYKAINYYPASLSGLSDIIFVGVSYDETELHENTLVKIQQSSKLTLVGSIQTSFDDTTHAYSLDTGASFNCREDIPNIQFNSANVFLSNDKYKINATMNLSSGSANYNSYMIEQSLTPFSSVFNHFNKMMIEYTGDDSGMKYYQVVNKRDYHNIYLCNMVDSSSSNVDISEATVQLYDTINVPYNKRYRITSSEFVTADIHITNIWLCN